MSTTVHKIQEEALNLPIKERAFLADRLLSSLSGEVLTDVDAAWITEAEHRYAEYQAGTRKPFPSTKVFDEADSMLK